MEGTTGNNNNRSSVLKSKGERESVKLKRKTIQAVLERAIESLSEDPCVDDEEEDDVAVEMGGEGSSDCVDKEADELRDLLRSRIEYPDFLEKLDTAQMSVSQHAVVVDDSNSWDVVSKNDLWECGIAMLRILISMNMYLLNPDIYCLSKKQRM